MTMTTEKANINIENWLEEVLKLPSVKEKIGLYGKPKVQIGENLDKRIWWTLPNNTGWIAAQAQIDGRIGWFL